MRLLLDTHTFLWFIGGDSGLDEYARGLIENRGNERFLSVASLWEMAIKAGIGKLEVPLPFSRLFDEHVFANAIEVLSIQAEHLDAYRRLPFHHRDPFDRLLIAQAVAEEMTVVTRDAAFSAYGVGVLWGEKRP